MRQNVITILQDANYIVKPIRRIIVSVKLTKASILLRVNELLIATKPRSAVSFVVLLSSNCLRNIWGNNRAPRRHYITIITGLHDPIPVKAVASHFYLISPEICTRSYANVSLSGALNRETGDSNWEIRLLCVAMYNASIEYNDTVSQW